MPGSRLVRITLPLLAVSLLASLAVAEIPNRSPKELAEAASQVVVGKVGRIYTRVERSQNDYEFTYFVAEVVTSAVEKGDAIKEGNLVYVRYWHKRYVGNAHGEPGHYGHRGAPDSGDRIRVFLTGDRHEGFDVVSPNGFATPPPAGADAPPPPPTDTPD